jgi:hypothetical protein
MFTLHRESLPSPSVCPKRIRSLLGEKPRGMSVADPRAMTTIVVAPVPGSTTQSSLVRRLRD